MKFYKNIQSMNDLAKIELLSVKKASLEEASNIAASIENQRDMAWWQRAVKEGYYEYPRKISLKDLSKKMDVAFSTLKDHLRRTELKLMKETAKKYANPLYSGTLLNKETKNS